MNMLEIILHKITVAGVECYFSIFSFLFLCSFLSKSMADKLQKQLLPEESNFCSSSDKKINNIMLKSLVLMLSINRGRKKIHKPKLTYWIALHGPYSLLYTHLHFIDISWCICSNLPQTLMCRNKNLALVLILYSLYSSTSQNLTSVDLSILGAKCLILKQIAFIPT